MQKRSNALTLLINNINALEQLILSISFLNYNTYTIEYIYVYHNVLIRN